MRWLKQFVNILFVFCVLVIIKCSSTKRVEKNSGRLKNNFNSLGATQHHDRAGKRVKTNSLVNTEAERLKHESGKQRLHSSHVSITSNSRRHDNAFRLIIPQRQRLRSKTRDKSDGTKSHGTNDGFSKTATINYPEIHQQIIVTRKDGARKKATLQSRYISNKWLSKLDITKDKTIGIEANFNGFLNKRKRGYEKLVSSHRISKRNLNTSLPTQPSVTPTTELPILIPPLRLPTLPPAPQYNIPPVWQKSCSGRCTGNVTGLHTDERLACYCDTACYEIFNDCCTDYTKYCCVQKPSEIPIKKFNIPTCQSEKSCKGRCSNNTEWRTEIKMRCSCDPDCYQVFNDCCSDYTKYCGAQKPTETLTMKYNYTCEDVGHSDGDCIIGDGLWMVARCRPDWPHDTFRTKCEAPVDMLTMSSPDLYGYLPVLGLDNTTFRNMYCAICNGVQKNEPWPLDIQTTATPPEICNLTEKIHFLLTYKAKFPDGKGLWRPGKNQARRYCVKNIIDSCPFCGKALSCNNGDVALISADEVLYKNTQCAACHGLLSERFSCFPDGLHKYCIKKIFVPQPFSQVLNSGQAETEIQTQIPIYDEECGKSGLIFDDILQVCRVNWLSPPEQNGQERFYVFAWLEPPQKDTSFTPTQFQESLAKYLNVSRLQLFDINITTVLLPRTDTLLFYLVSSTIALTPQQSLELLSVNRNGNTNSSQTTKLLNYIYFSESFALQIKGLPFSVAKTTSRPLACVGKTTYTSAEYTLQAQERVLITSTNKTYEQFEYYRENVEQLGVKRGNITVCEKFVPAKCDGSIVQYTPEEYMTMVNLSIYVSKTSSLYNYGEYEILSNKSVAICQKFKVCVITEVRQTVRDNEDLGYITFIFSLLSMLFLIFLLVTYILFPQLRTLPGKNLMNLAASLLLFEMFWLPSSFSEVREDKPTCMAMAIMEHYFLMASFASMSVIAFHMCKVFARKLPAPKMSERRERKLFCTYFALVWLVPAVFVAICVLLDHQSVVKIGYGESEICWLTENNAYTYFIAIPIALLLLFNIIAFVITAVYIRKHGQNQAAKQASGNKRSNLSIFVKLSTLMGFTWLFGLLALVVTSTTVFWYFFVISTSLQGVFVAVAFVMNAKTFNMYKQEYKKFKNSSSVQIPPNPLRRNVATNVTTIYYDTKL